jgi:ornithine cyclodeaminase/alanine dehydrogenase-like protein (mu-crystallin family)
MKKELSQMPATDPAASVRREPRVGEELLYLTYDDVSSLGISRAEVMESTRLALTEHGRQNCEMPAKIGLHPLPDTLMHAMPAYLPGAQACGIKWSSCFPDNARRGLDQTSGVLVLNDWETGYPIAIMDSDWITAQRTPAVSALACERLARPDSAVLAIVGAGVQGRGHLEVLPTVLESLREVRIVDARPDLAEAVVRDAADRPYTVRAVATIEDAVRGADVVVSATAILQTPNPLVRHEWVQTGATLLPVDFDSIWEWETLSGADKFIVDSIEQMNYFHRTGYLPNGLPSVHAEIGQVVAGLRPGREHDDELIIDMNIGMAVEDMVLAREIVTRAVDAGRGRVLPL